MFFKLMGVIFISDEKVSKCVMKSEIAKLKEEIKEIERKISMLKKRKIAYEAKIELMVREYIFVFLCQNLFL